MTIGGTLFRQDGKTPAADVILYVYHTDNKGYYSPSPGQVNGKFHGHLRGWMKTDATGHYEFTSIRPAAYPSRNSPAHVHALIKENGKSIYWIDEYLFDDDPLITNSVRAGEKKRGGSGIIQLKKNGRGVWIGKRDIVLGKNIENY